MYFFCVSPVPLGLWLTTSAADSQLSSKVVLAFRIQRTKHRIDVEKQNVRKGGGGDDWERLIALEAADQVILSKDHLHQ